MDKADLSRVKIPNKPGVYFFLGSKREILYIGKATSLAHRVKSYFSNDLEEKRSRLIKEMVGEAQSLEWTVTDSVLEALLLETNLIRTHKPRYNTRSKDDKSYNHVVITNEDYPRVFMIRAKDLQQADEGSFRAVYGPFPSGTLLKDAMRIVRKLFKVYDKDATHEAHRSKIRKGKTIFNTQIGLYPENVTVKEYERTIKHLCLFFEGKKAKIIADLEKEMQRCAKAEHFEEAQRVKKQMFALQHIQDVSLIKDESREYQDGRTMRIEAYDVAHLQGDNMVGAMTVIQNGERAQHQYRKFIIHGCKDANDPKALHEMFSRRLNHTEWELPALIVADGNTIQMKVIERVLKSHGLVVPVVGVTKDEHHKPIKILGPGKIIREYKDLILLGNAEAHRFAINFHRKRQRATVVFK